MWSFDVMPTKKTIEAETNGGYVTLIKKPKKPQLLPDDVSSKKIQTCKREKPNDGFAHGFSWHERRKE